VPSVRTPHVAGFQPHHLALFVPHINDPARFDKRSKLVAKMKIEFEFLTHAPPISVTYQHARINWAAPRFQVTAIAGEPSLPSIPAYPGRPSARTYALNQWHEIEIVF